MYVTNITDLNTTNDYDLINDEDTTNNITENCTITENNIAISIPTLLLTILCGLSFLCLTSSMVYTLVKPLFNIN